MKVKVLATICLIMMLLAGIIPSIAGQDGGPVLADRIFRGLDFANGTSQGLSISASGLTLGSDVGFGSFGSPIISAPMPFNAVVPQWVAEVPESANMTIRVRTGKTNGAWSKWFTVNESHDWTRPEDPDVVGEMITVPAIDVTHDRIQFSVNFSRSGNSPPPTLNELRLTFIDSTDGPSSEALLRSQEAAAESAPASTESGYPKPTVISRNLWCTHQDCNYSDGLEYEPVSHLVLHHTVSSNDNSDWAAVVRAIWSFHTFTRGWGDIGYNYLVDMNGIIYEGHLGGDNVVGTHAAGANKGSMGVAMIGDFRYVTPPAAMRNAAASLFSWKADQRNIDVFDSGVLPNMDWGLPNLMGHRDVYGTTVCPGDMAHDLLPWLRGEVANRINFTSPYIYLDELSGAFTRSGSSSWKSSDDLSIDGCGFNGHSFYTWSTQDPSASSVWAEWRPPLGSAGRYEIQAHVPFCKTGRAETDGAQYRVTHGSGTSQVTVSQEEGLGTWISLGRYNLNAGSSTVIRLTDLTNTDEGKGIWFDAIRFRPAEPCTVPVISNQTPADNTWIDQRTVNFSWNITGAFCVGNTRLEIAEDPAFTEPVISVVLGGAPTSHQLTFTKDYSDLFWRVVATTTENQVGSSSPTRFGIDTEAPISSTVTIMRNNAGDYYASLSGEDSSSGVVSYNVDFRADNSTDWERWLTETAVTTIRIPWDVDQTYWFRSQAVDAVGRTEPVHMGNGDTNTDQAIQLQRAIIAPYFRQD